MTPYLEMNALIRNLICFWSILLILGFIAIVILSLKQKNYVSTLFAVVSNIVLYFIMQVCREISSWKLGYNLNPIAMRIASIPSIIYILVLLGFTIACSTGFYMYLKYAHTHITPMSIKEAADQSPIGVLYYSKEGNIILTNHRMNEISFDITGKALLNAQEFFDAIKGKSIYKLQDGSVVRFTHKEISFDGAICCELIADDITELYDKTETLRHENDFLQSQNVRMKEYGKIIDENVRRQEILNTKTRIHDEMNQLLLSTDKTIRQSTMAEKQKILDTWKKNILLLCMEAETDRINNAFSDLEAFSKIIGVKLHYDKLPETDNSSTLHLFSLAAEEAMANAAKHGNAKNLYINIMEDDNYLTAVFTNDGTIPNKAFTEGGGLTALRKRIEESGGKMQTSLDERFTLTVKIPQQNIYTQN